MREIYEEAHRLGNFFGCPWSVAYSMTSYRAVICRATRKPVVLRV